MNRIIAIGCLLITGQAVAQNGVIVVGAGAGDEPEIRLYEPMTGSLVGSLMAFDTGFTGGVRVAVGDVNGDGTADIIAGAGPSGLSLLRVFDGVTHSMLLDVFPYGSRFSGGVNVAAGDLNGDGFDEVITGPGESSPPTVVVYDGATLTEIGSFDGDNATFERGLHVASADVDGDGDDDIVTGRVFGPNGSGFGPNSLMRVFNGPIGGQLGNGTAFNDFVQSGVFVAAGDLDNDGKAEIIAGPDGPVGSLTQTFNDTSVIGSLMFFSFAEPNFGGGVRVASGDVNGDGMDDIVVGAGPWTNPVIGPLVNVYSGNSSTLISSFFAGDPMNSNGIYIAGPWEPGCIADVNNDGVLSPADFSAWVAAFNAMAPGCDQNGDGACTPADFSAWVANFNAGC
ncbi:MAG: VCBS repeat-containing protein [Phycisphaerales bacterium]|nr:VCBS repeat-containing protein [Phycisphaerales bacterium]